MSTSADAAASKDKEGESSCDDEWFGPDNLPSVEGAADAVAAAAVRVGCITTDYAMQNVLLQIGLNLLSLDGVAVKSVRQYVLKCDACYDITTKMDKLFCPSCGNPSLAKLGVTLRKNGQPDFHYAKGRRVNIRGSKYPLPNPKGGRQGDLLLREDQLLTGVWKQRRTKTETMTTMFADCNSADLMAARSVVGADVVVGFGRRNPNALKGRERRGKKKPSGGK